MSPAKTAEPIRMPFGLWSWVGPCIKWEPGSTGEGAILGVVSLLKRIRLCKQQTCQLVRVADLPGRRSLHSARTAGAVRETVYRRRPGFPSRRGLIIWNSLPDNVISAPSLSTFRQTFLFHTSFFDIIIDPR